jgi:hypothetical protein
MTLAQYASAVLYDDLGGPAFIVLAKTLGIAGNSISIQITSPSVGLFNVSVRGIIIGQGQIGQVMGLETYTNIAGKNPDGPNSPFWSNLQTTIASSQLIQQDSFIDTSRQNPALGTFSLTGGTDR